LRYNSAQWMSTCLLMKSNAVSKMYSSQDVRKACPCALSPSKWLGMPGLTLEGCDACRGVITLETPLCIGISSLEGIWIPVYFRDIGWLILCNTTY
jgi:hypothetical protein